MWDFSRYNVIVQQVEGVADLLRDAANRIAPTAHQDPDGVAPLLLAGLRLAADEMDARALAMISVYDPMAQAYIRQGLKRDPRRGPVKNVDPRPPAIAAVGDRYDPWECRVCRRQFPKFESGPDPKRCPECGSRRVRPANPPGGQLRKLLKKGR